MTISWVWWVYGSLRPILDSGSKRAGEGVSLSESFGKQMEYLWDSMPALLVLGFLGLVLAAWSHHGRQIAVIGMGAVVVYALTFFQGAYVHQYWNFAIVLPLAIGAAALIDRALQIVGDNFIPRTVLLGFLAILSAGSLYLHSSAKDQRDQGFAVAGLFDEVDHLGPPTGPKLGLLGQTITGTPWAFYETDGRTLDLEPRSIEVTALKHPDLQVLLPSAFLTIINRDERDLEISAEAGGLAVIPLENLKALLDP
ncbi:MAG: hypothetical protein KDB26_04600 [Microthrixaceae bacterium]|nr:hypothetical protein [Microthrixaceae bacterium]